MFRGLARPRNTKTFGGMLKLLQIRRRLRRVSSLFLFADKVKGFVRKNTKNCNFR